MNLKIHPDCFKIKDPRIKSLLNGALSANRFAMSLTATDPFVLIGDTIYAMNECDYWIAKAVLMDYTGNRTVLSMLEHPGVYTHMMSKEDAERLKVISEDIKTCPVCRAKKHREEVLGFVRKYNIGDHILPEGKPDETPYPGCTEEFSSSIEEQLGFLRKIKVPNRKHCLDCTEKHIAQAYVLSTEVVLGYPSHFPLMLAHLAEAYAEAPAEFPALRDTLSFCVAESMRLHKPFLPFHPIMETLTVTREFLRQNNETEQTFDSELPEGDIEFKPEMLPLDDEEIPWIQDMTKDVQAIVDFITQYKKSPSEELRMQFEGRTALLAEKFVVKYPEFSKMVRWRRLLYYADPGLIEAPYDFTDVLQYLKATLYDRILHTPEAGSVTVDPSTGSDCTMLYS